MSAGVLDSTWHAALRFALAALAVYRVAYLVARDDGPWEMLRRLRSSAKDSPAGRLLTCFNCLSVWLSLPLAWFVGESWIERVVAWWALSGAAVLLDRATRDPFEVDPRERSS